MATKLSRKTQPVKQEPKFAKTLPADFDHNARVSALIDEVQPFLPGLELLKAGRREQAASVAIAAVQFLIQENRCLCLDCLHTYTRGEPLLRVYVRAEVKHRTGTPAKKIAHTPNVSK